MINVYFHWIQKTISGVRKFSGRRSRIGWNIFPPVRLQRRRYRLEVKKIFKKPWRRGFFWAPPTWSQKYLQKTMTSWFFLSSANLKSKKSSQNHDVVVFLEPTNLKSTNLKNENFDMCLLLLGLETSKWLETWTENSDLMTLLGTEVFQVIRWSVDLTW